MGMFTVQLAQATVLRPQSVQDRSCTNNVTQARPCNLCRSGKAISITYSEYVSVALGIRLLQWKGNMYYIVSVYFCSLRYPFVGSGKAISITYSECVSVALGIRLLQWKSNKCYIFCVCVCSLRCPAFNARVPYCRLWPVWMYIFRHYLINGTIFEKKLQNTKCVF